MTDKVEVSVAKMEVQVQRLEQDMTELKEDVKAIRAVLDRADGGWRMLVIVGGIAAAIGGIVTKVMSSLDFLK